jgi:hypothetical protein
MTDLQFYAIERDKWELREADLRRENKLPRKSDADWFGDGMTDLQFFRIQRGA